MGDWMRAAIVIGLVLLGLVAFGCTGTPQQSASDSQSVPTIAPQQPTQPNKNTVAQDHKYSSECMSASMQASRSKDYQTGIINCTNAINAISSEKEKALPYRFRAGLKRSSGDLEGADADFTLSISADPNDYVGYENRGCLRYVMGKTAEANADIDKAHALNPSTPSSGEYNFAGLCRK